MGHETREKFDRLADELNSHYAASSGDRITPEMIEAKVRNFERVEKLRKSAKGKFKVLGIDKFSHDDWVEGEYDSAEEALRVARTKTNEAKKNCFGDGGDSIATVYYAYDPEGNYLGGDT